GAALAEDIWQCDGLVDFMSYWTFDDVFEESGVVREPFYGGFGIIGAGGIKKPAFHAYALLHRLGETRLANPAHNLLVTRRKDGTVVVATWNVVDPDRSGEPRAVTLRFTHVQDAAPVAIRRVDATHGNVLPAYAAMGSPRYPTAAQVQQLNRASAPGAPEHTSLRHGEIRITVPVNGLVVLELPLSAGARRSAH
ncbi:MAG TPA: hypothetical protein VF931_00040, partial [Steroidobacteraceae bacterium]